MSGDLASLGRHALQGAVLAWEEKNADSVGARRVVWHVLDTEGSEQLAVEAADACILQGGLLVVTPPRGSDFDFLAGGLMDRGAGVFVPVAGLTDVTRLDKRFVFVRPPLAETVGRTLAEAAQNRRGEGVGAALVLNDGSARDALSAWSKALSAGGWRDLPTRELPGPEPEPWRRALHEVVEAGATDVLVIGTHTGNRPIIEEMSQAELADVHLWFLEGRIHDALLVEAEFRRALDRVHFLVGKPPSAIFSARYEERWREEPEVGAAEVYESVMRAYDGAEDSVFLEPLSLAASARRASEPSAWSSGERVGPEGLDSVAAAGYESAFMRRKTAPSWIWEQVQESDQSGVGDRRRPVAPSRVHHRPSGFSVESRSIGTKPGHDSLVGSPHARCQSAEDGTARDGGNQSPELRWSTPPRGTKSLALLVVDPDVPVDRSRENKKGVMIPADAERTDFYHWAVVDIPPEVREIPLGASAVGQGLLRPKPFTEKSFGREGVNDYSVLFDGDVDRAGDYFGWDGPCPAWNDERIHRLGFFLYALDVDSLELPETFGGREVEAAIEGHVLAGVSFSALYFTSPSLVLPPVPERDGF